MLTGQAGQQAVQLMCTYVEVMGCRGRRVESFVSSLHRKQKQKPTLSSKVILHVTKY